MEKEFIKDLVEYEREVQRIFATDIFDFFGFKKTRNLFVSAGGVETGGGRFSRVLLFMIGARESNESHEYAFLQYIEVTSSIGTVDETLMFVCLRWSITNKVGQSLRRETGISEQEV